MPNIQFNYSKGYPENSELREAQIREKYKQVVKEFPNEPILFSWTGERWSITALDHVRIRMNELDNENKQEYQE
jgi:hypothetical protein